MSEIERVKAHAVRTFGSEEKATQWLNTPCGALNHQFPMELLRAADFASVEEELNRIDYGIFV